MTDDEQTLLEAWAHGEAGAPLWLARRAWLVLQDAGRAPPQALARAWGRAAGARHWLLRWHRLGPLGLLDAPRSGRPPLWAGEIDAYRADTAAAQAAAPRGLREAVWRDARRTGQPLARSPQALDIPMAAPEGLPGLALIWRAPGALLVGAWPAAVTAQGRLVHCPLSHPATGPGLQTSVVAALARLAAQPPPSRAHGARVTWRSVRLVAAAQARRQVPLTLQLLLARRDRRGLGLAWLSEAQRVGLWAQAGAAPVALRVGVGEALCEPPLSALMQPAAWRALGAALAGAPARSQAAWVAQ